MTGTASETHVEARPQSPKKEDRDLYCSFCGKSQHEVKKLIAGPTVFICDECVGLCLEIVDEDSPLANTVFVGPAISKARAGELEESGFTLADLLKNTGILCADPAILKRPVFQVLSEMAASVKDHLATYNGKASVQSRIEALEKKRQEKADSIEETMRKYREDSSPGITSIDMSLQLLRERLAGLQEPAEVATADAVGLEVKAQMPTSSV